MLPSDEITKARQFDDKPSIDSDISSNCLLPCMKTILRGASMWSNCRRLIRLASIFVTLLPLAVAAQQYHRTDLTADTSTTSPTAPHIDPQLVNAWGLARGSGSPWWVADNGTGLSTLYDGAGAKVPLVVTIPTPDGTGTSTPTGMVFNSTSGFLLGPGAKSAFIFVTEDGTISGWNPAVDPNAVIKVNRSGKAIYKGCAVAQVSHGPRLFATNFLSGAVEVFDANFTKLNISKTAFQIPDLPDGYAPFNIQNVGGDLVITFAHRAPGSTDEDHGAGLGYAGIFSPTGALLVTLQHGSWFDAPWGIALAPGDFGAFTHQLLIGNFGSGTIHAFDPFTGQHKAGMLDDTTGKILKVDGLWAISFGGDAANNGPSTTMFFSSGPNDENNGLFGQITAVSAEQPGNSR
jgi:uncharacterized protein (TIGR03118 family)